MTSQQIYTQLYQFLGGRTCRGGFKTRAIKSVKIFRDNCLIPFEEIKSISFSYGKYSNIHGKYYGENRDVLNIEYTSTTNEKYHFAIMD